MGNKLDYQFLIIKSFIGANKQDTDKKTKKHCSEFSEIKKFFKHIMVHNQNPSTDNMESQKAQDPETVVPSNKKAPLLESAHSIEHGSMWTLKHEINLPKL